MDIAKLNAISSSSAYLPTKRLEDLEKDERYIVTRLRQSNTRYGPRIIVNIDESFQVFLPERVSRHIHGDLFDKLVEKADKNTLYINYLGNKKFVFE